MTRREPYPFGLLLGATAIVILNGLLEWLCR